jgi:F-type H+-transporting ATPase subunit beta
VETVARARELIGDQPAHPRVSRLRSYLTQPFFVTEPFTGNPGGSVSVDQAVADCRAILDGRHDDVPAEALYMAGTMADSLERPARKKPASS